MKKILLILLLFVLFCLGCDEKHQVVRSFCYWKTTMYADTVEDSLMTKMNIGHLYVRYFDVDWNPYAKEALPVSSIGIGSMIGPNCENKATTPAIFITNDVLLQSDKPALDTLARRIRKRISQIDERYLEDMAQRISWKIVNAHYQKQTGTTKRWLNSDSIAKSQRPKLQKSITEILIDCDWTQKTKDNYFYLLTQIKKQFPKCKIAATIRLWQYKYYEKAGIPPVDKGLLMCYNMTSPDEHTTENSIGSSKELEQFLTHSDYKLKLDIALPLFSWAVIFRGNTFKGILSENIDLQSDTIRFKKISGNRLVLQDDILAGDTYLRNGDEIRVEKISDAEIHKMIAIIKDKIDINNQTKVTFFSLDKKYINAYGTDKVSQYYALF